MKKTIWIGNIIITVLILLLTFSSFSIPMPVTRQINDYSVEGESGWHYADGSDADLTDLHYVGNETHVSKSIRADSIEALTMCFDTANVAFTVYLNNEPIYDYHPKLLKIYGESYGLDYHAVTIPYFMGGAELMIRAEDLSGGTMWAGFRNIVFENGANNLLHSMKSAFLNGFHSFLIFSFGVLTILLGFILKLNEERKLEFFSLGTLSIVLCMWTITNRYYPGMLLGNPAYIRMINYISLMLIPVCGITLVACLTKQTRSRFVPIIMGLTFFNLLLHLVMLITGLAEYHDLLFVSHVILALGVVFVCILIVHGIRHRTMQERDQLVILSAFLILMGCGVTDLLLYYIKHSRDAVSLARFGLLAFVVILGVYEIQEFISISEKNRENEIAGQLTRTDGLTGLENRLSFMEYEEKLKKAESGKCMFIRMDINNLRKVNDEFGHAKGDEYIIAAATIIKSTFDDGSRIFRVGGDEFMIIAMSGDESTDKYFGKYCARMLDKVERYNRNVKPEIPLDIAYGMAECNLGKDDPESIEHLADQRMYERKQKMESQNI